MLLVDIDQARVVFATEGNDAATIAAFADDVTAHGGDRDAISQVCIEMSPAFTKSIAENLPNAAIAFDKFHEDCIATARRDEAFPHALQRRKALYRGCLRPPIHSLTACAAQRRHHSFWSLGSSFQHSEQLSPAAIRHIPSATSSSGGRMGVWRTAG